LIAIPAQRSTIKATLLKRRAPAAAGATLTLRTTHRATLAAATTATGAIETRTLKPALAAAGPLRTGAIETALTATTTATAGTFATLGTAAEGRAVGRALTALGTPFATG
jgi:hypothetical protein